jgi:thermostable 8-oxoguanine DNA glycosylase
VIDPANITKYGRSKAELQELAIFCILVAGKKARTMAIALDKLLTKARALAAVYKEIANDPTDGRFSKRVATLDLDMPFDVLFAYMSRERLQQDLKACGIGCHTRLAHALFTLVRADLDLATCTAADLERLPSLGPKTARFFMVHSRPNQRLAVLDTHVLKFLNEQGHFVPSSTPTGRRYLEIEQLVLDYCDAAGMSPADWDLTVWRYYSGEPDAEPPPVFPVQQRAVAGPGRAVGTPTKERTG